MAMEEEPLRTGFDPNDRELCPDGACIGIIGPGDRCAECGKASTKKGASAGSKPAVDARPLAAHSPDDAKAPSLGLGLGLGPSPSPGPREVEGDGFDPKRRELCADGACIGVIGADGRCVECGKASSDGPPSAGPTATEADRDDDAPAPKKSDGTTDDSPGIEKRVLCPDGACIGVIGSNGRCKVCGTRAE